MNNKHSNYLKTEYLREDYELIQEILKQTRLAAGMTQRALANEVNVAQCRISSYENGEDIPIDIAVKISRVLKSPRLRQAISCAEKDQIISIPILNNVNDDPAVILDSLVEEAGEMIESSMKLKKIIRNRNTLDDLTEVELENVMAFEEQIADIIPAVQLHFIRMAEIFGLDISRIEKRMIMKLKKKKYLV